MANKNPKHSEDELFISSCKALAREYAEEIYPDLSDKIISLRTMEIKNAERLIRFLLRRNCLVEKDKVKEAYLEAKITTKEGYKVKSGCMIAVGEASKELLETLFPDIAKEEQ